MILYIVRGLPGSGKSTLAARLVANQSDRGADEISPEMVFEADQYFMSAGGVYNFDPTKLKEAHADCLRRATEEMARGSYNIAVSNTFTQEWEIQPYLNAAAEYKYKVFILTCENCFGSIHGVPEESIQRMASRWVPMDPRLQ